MGEGFAPLAGISTGHRNLFHAQPRTIEPWMPAMRSAGHLLMQQGIKCESRDG